MRKTRSDSVLDNLPAEQQETIERWLLDENLSLGEAAVRIHAEFKVEVGPNPITRFIEKCRTRRDADKLRDQIEDFEQADQPDVSTETIGKLIRQHMASMAFQQSSDPKHLSALMQSLTRSQYFELRRQENDLARQRFQLSSVKGFLKAWPEVRRELAGLPKNALDDDVRLRQVRVRVFGEGCLNKEDQALYDAEEEDRWNRTCPVCHHLIIPEDMAFARKNYQLVRAKILAEEAEAAGTPPEPETAASAPCETVSAPLPQPPSENNPEPPPPNNPTS